MFLEVIGSIHGSKPYLRRAERIRYVCIALRLAIQSLEIVSIPLIAQTRLCFMPIRLDFATQMDRTMLEFQWIPLNFGIIG